jgi:hypothetical protein
MTANLILGSAPGPGSVPAAPRLYSCSIQVTFTGACSVLETALRGPARRDIAADLSSSTDLRQALLRLRDSLRAHVFKTRAGRIDLAAMVGKYDSRTRQDGFHVLHDWDGKADKVNEDIIPVDVLHYLIEQRGAEPPNRSALAILLDYYFVHILALLSLRLWDEGDGDSNLERLNGLLAELQGADGSGHQFVDNAETLILIATSHFEPDTGGFGRLLDQVRTLNRSHRMNIALGHAGSLGCHLRFGFEATYGRDTLAARSDNTVDYPWLCFSLATLIEEYARMEDDGAGDSAREAIVEGLLNGLSADAGAFVAHPPAVLAESGHERSEFGALFQRYKQRLLEEFARYRPSAGAYSPIAFFFNFSHNVLKGMVLDALLWGEPRKLTLNDLLTGIVRGRLEEESKETVARTLMAYARSNPDRIRGRLMPVIVYDPESGHRAFALAMRKMRG